MQLLNYSYCLTVFDADFKMPVKMITVYHVWRRLSSLPLLCGLGALGVSPC